MSEPSKQRATTRRRASRSDGDAPLAKVDDVASVLDRAKVVICCGTGGVGKTTTAAALAIAAAWQGRRVAVVTIDPARRLADALGVGPLGNDPQRVPDEALDVAHVTSSSRGELWALMLDAAKTFDALVQRYATDERQRDRILANPFYRNISSRLSGTQEYMAAEKLYELATDDRFDLVVVDTPPAHNALDFLDAPERLTRFLDHRVYRALMAPTRAYLRAVNVATQAILRPIAKVVGAEVIADAMAFFQAFDGMEAGFRQRAVAVREMLAADATTYVLVAAPRTDAVAEAGWFADRLASLGHTVGALVVNRTHAVFGAANATTASDDAASAAKAARAARDAGHDAIAEWWATLADLRRVAAAEASEVHDLASRVSPAPVANVALRPTDVHAIADLVDIAATIVPSFFATRAAPQH